jgi:outer membrane autotransporter protein/uncharacterized repeat protein (TIGR01451 family)
MKIFTRKCFALLALAAAPLSHALTISVAAPANNAPGIGAGKNFSITVGSIASGTILVSKPVGLIFVNGSATAGWTCNDSAPPATCTNVSPSGTSFNVDLRSPATFADPINLPDGTATISVDQVGNTPASATAFYTARNDILITPPAAVTVAANTNFSLPFSVISGTVGSPLNFQFQQTQVRFTLPNDVSYLSSTAPAFNCVFVAPIVTCSINQPGATSIPSNFPITLNLRRNANPTATTQVQYDVATPNNDPNPSNNQGSVNVVFVQPTADLALSGTAASGNSGASVTQNFQVQSLGGDIVPATLTISQSSAQTQQIQNITIGTTAPAGTACTITGGGTGAICNIPPFLSSSGPFTFAVQGILPTVNFGQTAQLTMRGQLRSPGTLDSNLTNNDVDLQFSAAGAQASSAQTRLNSSTSQPAQGQVYTYTLSTLVSIESLPANALRMRLPLPDSVSFLSIEESSPGLSCSGGSIIECTQASVLPGETASAKVRVQTLASSGIISATLTTTAANFAQQLTAISELIVRSEANADLVLTKTDSIDPVAPSTDFDYLLQVQNAGSIAAANVTLLDALPTGLNFISATSSEMTCSGGRNVSCTMATLAAGASASVRVRANANNTGTVINEASVSTITAESNLANNRDTESTTISSSTFVAIDAELTGPANTSVRVGSSTTLDYGIRNLTPGNGSCELRVGIKSGVGFGLATPPGANCSLSNSTVVCAITVNPNFNTTRSVSITAAAAGQANVEAALVCTNESNVSNNIISTAVLAQADAGADLRISARDDDPVLLDSEYVYRLTIANAGPDAAAAVILKATLADGVDFVSASGATCGASGQTVNCAIAAPIAANAAATIELRARARGEIGEVLARFEVTSTTRDPVAGNNLIEERTVVNARDTQQVVATVLTPALTDQFARDAAPVVADICARPVAALAAQCEAIIDAALERNLPALEAGLRAFFPEEALSQRLAVLQQSETQFSNVDSRLNELRGGGSGLSFAGLNMQFGRTNLPLGLLQSMLQADEETEVGGSGDLISPWGFFINGTYSRGDQSFDRTRRTLSSEFDNVGLTAGFDYRFSARTVGGLALGYNKFDSELADDGETRNKALSFTAYGSHYFNDNFYTDARLTYGTLDFDTVRRIRFSFQNFSINDTALGQTDGTQMAFAAGAGYHLRGAGFSFTPNANVRYSRNRIDGYTETNAAANNMIFDDQTINSFQYSLGLQVSKPISLSHGVLVPQFDLSLSSESRDASYALNARLNSVAANQGFVVRSEEADSSFGNVGLGLVYATSNGKQAYLNYRRLFGNDQVERDTINLGARFEF